MNIKNLWARIVDSRKKRVLYTLYFNFKHFPFHQAKRLPVIFYKGAYATIRDGGRIVLTKAFWKNRGKVYVGTPTMDFEYQCERTYLNISNGYVEFNGTADFRRGNMVEVKGVCVFGNDVVFGPRCRTRVHNQLNIGDVVRIAHETQIFDSNFHYVEDVENPGFRPISRPVSIGSNVWICNRSTVQSGAILPAQVIVASNSLVNKNYSNLHPNSLIGGSPAKLIKEGISRVWDTKRELEYHKQEFGW